MRLHSLALPSLGGRRCLSPTAKLNAWMVAGLLGLGMLDSQADSYTIQIETGYNLIANQLDNGGNTLNEVLIDFPSRLTAAHS